MPEFQMAQKPPQRPQITPLTRPVPPLVRREETKPPIPLSATPRIAREEKSDKTELFDYSDISVNEALIRAGRDDTGEAQGGIFHSKETQPEKKSSQPPRRPLDENDDRGNQSSL